MPILKSAKKALRQSKRREVKNLQKKNALKKIIKEFQKLVKNKKIDEAKAKFPSVQKALDKATKTGILKRNNAARKKSRLAHMLK